MNQEKSNTKHNQKVLIVLLSAIVVFLLASGFVLNFKLVQSQAITNALQSDSAIILEQTDDGFQEIDCGQKNFLERKFKKNCHWGFDASDTGVKRIVSTYDTICKEGYDTEYFKAKSFEDSLQLLPALPSEPQLCVTTPKKYSKEELEKLVNHPITNVKEGDLCDAYPLARADVTEWIQE